MLAVVGEGGPDHPLERSPCPGVANVIRIAGSARPYGVQSALTQDSAGQVPSSLSSM